MAKKGMFLSGGRKVAKLRRLAYAFSLNFLVPGFGTAFLGFRRRGLVQVGLVVLCLSLLLAASFEIYFWMLGLGFPLEAWREGFSSFPPEVQREVELKFSTSPPRFLGLPSLWLFWGSLSGLIFVWFWGLVSVFLED